MEDRLSNILDDLDIEETTALLEEDINLSMNTFSKRRIMKSVHKKIKNEEKNYKIINRILGGLFMKRKLILSGLMLATIIIGGIGGYSYANATVAYVSLDINPSVELGVNRFDQVVSVEGYNEDGKNILENTDLKNDDINEAVGTLIENAIDKGYITSDNDAVISLTTATENTSVAEKLEDSLKDVADEVLDNNNIEAEIEEDNVALQRRDEARKLGITPGKLNLIQKLQALDSNIKVEEYKNISVKEIQKKNKELRKGNLNNENNNDEINDDLNNNDEKNIPSEGIGNKTEQDDSANYSNEENILKEETKNSYNNSNNDKDKEFNPNKPEKLEENNSSNLKTNNSNKPEQKDNKNSSSNSQGKNPNKK